MSDEDTVIPTRSKYTKQTEWAEHETGKSASAKPTKAPNRKAKRAWGLRKTAKRGKNRRRGVSLAYAEQPWRGAH